MDVPSPFGMEIEPKAPPGSPNEIQNDADGPHGGGGRSRVHGSPQAHTGVNSNGGGESNQPGPMDEFLHGLALSLQHRKLVNSDLLLSPHTPSSNRDEDNVWASFLGSGKSNSSASNYSPRGRGGGGLGMGMGAGVSFGRRTRTTLMSGERIRSRGNSGDRQKNASSATLPVPCSRGNSGEKAQEGNGPRSPKLSSQNSGHVSQYLASGSPAGNTNAGSMRSPRASMSPRAMGSYQNLWNARSPSTPRSRPNSFPPNTLPPPTPTPTHPARAPLANSLKLAPGRRRWIRVLTPSHENFDLKGQQPESQSPPSLRIPALPNAHQTSNVSPGVREGACPQKLKGQTLRVILLAQLYDTPGQQCVHLKIIRMENRANLDSKTLGILKPHPHNSNLTLFT
ncbi:hypothetical protein AAMO2058_001021400 [Amorphochlora amoebiformis]